MRISRQAGHRHHGSSSARASGSKDSGDATLSPFLPFVYTTQPTPRLPRHYSQSPRRPQVISKSLSSMNDFWSLQWKVTQGSLQVRERRLRGLGNPSSHNISRDSCVEKWGGGEWSPRCPFLVTVYISRPLSLASYGRSLSLYPFLRKS